MMRMQAQPMKTITNVELNGTDLDITEAGSTSSVSLATLQDGNNFVTAGNLTGTNLTLNIPGQTNPVINLSGLQDGTGNR